MKPIQVGLLGIGTVGSGTFNVLKRNQEEITRRAGRGIEIAAVAVRDVGKAREVVGPDMPVTTNAGDVVRRPDIDIVVELIGGYEPARTLVLEAIARGKHVVTANKALLARHGNEIFEAARAQGVMVAFEAAVAASKPSIIACRASRHFAASAIACMILSLSVARGLAGTGKLGTGCGNCKCPLAPSGLRVKKEGRRIDPGPFKCEGQKPPEGNSCCGGTGRKKPPCASAVCDMMLSCASSNAFLCRAAMLLTQPCISF